MLYFNWCFFPSFVRDIYMVFIKLHLKRKGRRTSTEVYRSLCDSELQRMNSSSQKSPRSSSSSLIGPSLWAAEADMKRWWEAGGGALRSWKQAPTRGGSGRAAESGSGKKLRAANAEVSSGWVKGSVHAEASAHSAPLCCRLPGALVVGSTTLHHPAGHQHSLGYFLAASRVSPPQSGGTFLPAGAESRSLSLAPRISCVWLYIRLGSPRFNSFFCDGSAVDFFLLSI